MTVKRLMRLLLPLALALLVLLPTPAWAGGYITMGTQESPSGSGTTWQDGSGYYSTGDYIYLHASPYSGYEFDYWDIVDTDTGSTLIINPNADAVFSTYDLADVNLWAIAHFKSSSSEHNLEYHPVQYGTCTTNGNAAYAYCSDCGLIVDSPSAMDVYASIPAIPALGHDWGSGKVTTEPTEDAEGVRTFTCTVCGETRTKAIPKKEKKAEPAPTPTPTPTPAPTPAPDPSPKPEPSGGSDLPLPLYIVGGVGLVAVGALVGVLISRRKGE